MKYVALLRGINVGGNKKVDMKKLKTVFEGMGFKNVDTYINSGNVLFETGRRGEERLALSIEEHVKKKFGFEVPVVVRTAKNIQKLADIIPENWKNDADYKTDILFLWEKFASKKTLGLLKTSPKVDSLKYIDKAIVWHLKKKDYGKSGMHDLIGTEVYKNMTARNVNTVRKLALLLED